MIGEYRLTNQKSNVSARELLAPYQDVIIQMIDQRYTVMVSSENLEYSFSTYIISQDKDGRLLLKNTVPIDYIHDTIGCQDFKLTFGDVNLSTSLLPGDGVNFVFHTEQVECLQTSRKSLRKFFYLDDKGYIEQVNPFDQKTLIRKKLINLSEGGLSFEINYSGLLFYPGQEFSLVKIFINSKLVDTKSYRVLYIKKFFNMESHMKYFVGGCFI